MSFPPIGPQHRQQQQHPGRAACRTRPHAPEPRPDPPEALSSSWPTTNLRRQLASRAPGAPAGMPPLALGRHGDGSLRAPPPRALQQYRPFARSCESVLPQGRQGRASPPRAAEEARRPAPEEPLLRFSLRLTPEAELLLHRRNLEKQLQAARHPGPAGPLPPGGSRRVFASSRGGRRGPPVGIGTAQPPPKDLLLKISMLNDQHRYDDVEYEEEEAGGAAGRPMDEGLVRRCTEWLRGVESAAAPDRLRSLPHLSITQ